MHSGIGPETMDGGTGAGVDTIDHRAFNGHYFFDMATGLTNFTGESFKNFERAYMGDGNNTVIGNSSNNYIRGHKGNDNIDGGIGNDFIAGGYGDDTLRGGAGRDSIMGHEGDDVIYSDGDDGFYTGGEGDDTLISGHGREYFVGGPGADTVDHRAFNGDYKFDMSSGKTNFAGETFLGFEYVYMGNGNDTVFGDNSNNYIFGNGGDDSLSGRDGDDVLLGSAGDDTLYGSFGNDNLDGGEGNDVLLGGDGKDLLLSNFGQDRLIGGGDADRFIYSSSMHSPNSSKRDTIVYFRPGEGDRIDLSRIDANLDIAGNQAFKRQQLSYSAITGILTADVIGSTDDLSIELVNAQGAFLIHAGIIK